MFGAASTGHLSLNSLSRYRLATSSLKALKLRSTCTRLATPSSAKLRASILILTHN
ncbi:hypothetical protein FRC03_007463, partial [Tulasnella sp. 419]